MKNLLHKLLAYLLHHANRDGRDDHFYKVKDVILTKYGRHMGYDVQFIEGKECNGCDATGVYLWYNYREDYMERQWCYKCQGTGWYKKPVWNILARIEFAGYIFHRPYQRAYTKPETANPVIEGYIDHTRSKYGYYTKTVLFLLYEKGYLKRWYQSAGFGWRSYWWQPRNIPGNVVHLLKNGWDAYPLREFRSKIKTYLHNKRVEKSMGDMSPDELPF